MEIQTKISAKRAAIGNLQRQRWAKQHQKILSVAGSLFWKKGYLGTSIDDIAKTANVNKAAVYYYFKDKSFLLYEVISTPMKALLDLAQPIANSDLQPGEKLKDLITNHIKWQATHPGLAGIGHVERKNLPLRLRKLYISVRDEYENIIRKTVKEGIKQGEFSSGDAKLASLFILGLINSIIQWYKPKESLSADEIASEAWTYISKALKPGKDSKMD
ncbi:MAG: TetR family transcriptional regulator [Desulfobacteraceae bacterium]|nr:TetR family transcriptional regulator [Desulfobacteraceae bacterium]